MSRAMVIVLGSLFVLIGLIGFFAPGFAGAHLNATHNAVHLASGALAIFFGWQGSLRSVRRFAIVFGLVYLFLGIGGYAFGRPEATTLSAQTEMTIDEENGDMVQEQLLAEQQRHTDPKLWRVIPGVLELGTNDHILHLILGGIFLLLGLSIRVPQAISIQTPDRLVKYR